MIRGISLIFAITWSLVGCGGGVAPRTVVPIAGDVSVAQMSVLEDDSGFVMARISIRNLSNASLCVPASGFHLNPWPFHVTDESGQVVAPLPGLLNEDFGLGSETFYVLGRKNTLVKDITLSASVDFQPGQRFRVEWNGFAFDCNDVAAVAGQREKLGSLPVVELTASAILAR